MKIFILKGVFLFGIFLVGIYSAQHVAQATHLKYDDEEDKDGPSAGRNIYSISGRR
ncbi:MAG: hypothetical protein JSS34_08535 [Proteobacteria bacterium]|nr:hypothetical protein [Pseudomonadota bacterium]